MDRTSYIVFSEMFYDETNKYITEKGLLKAKDIHKILFALSTRLLSGELDEKAKNLDYTRERRNQRTFSNKMTSRLKFIGVPKLFRSKQVNHRPKIRAIAKSKNAACI